MYKTKKYNYTFLSLLILVLSSCSDKNKEVDYIGDISNVTITIYEAVSKFGEIECGDLEKMFELQFDENNLPIKVSEYDSYGDLSYLIKNKYDNRKHLVSSITYDGEGEEWSKCVIEYDGDFSIRSSYDSEYVHREVEYTNNGDYITEMRIFIDGELSNVQKQTKEGDVYKMTSYDPDGNITHKLVMNKHGKLNTILDPYDEITNTILYNDKSLPTKYINFSIYPTNLLDSQAYSTGDDTFVVDYEYDNQGNWIKKTASLIEGDNQIPKYIVVREFEYK